MYNYYQIANKNVAELCNHQKAAAANHGEVLAKFDEKIEKVRMQHTLRPAHTLRASRVTVATMA